MLSFEKWWGVIRDYNHTLFPLQFFIMFIGIIIIFYFAYGQKEKANVLIKGYLGICHLWIGIFFFIVLGKDFPSPLKYFQGALFISIGILLFIDLITKKTVFSFPKKRARKISFISLLIVVQLYPIVGLILGRTEDTCIYPGTFPCATTALALVFFSAALPKANKWIYGLLLIWAIPFAPLIQIPKYHVYEDSIMFIIGVYTLIYLIVSSIKFGKRRHGARQRNS